MAPIKHGNTSYWTEQRGKRNWETGELFRPGKTHYENQTGVKANYLRNKEARRRANRGEK